MMPLQTTINAHYNTHPLLLSTAADSITFKFVLHLLWWTSMIVHSDRPKRHIQNGTRGNRGFIEWIPSFCCGYIIRFSWERESVFLFWNSKYLSIVSSISATFWQENVYKYDLRSCGGGQIGGIWPSCWIMWKFRQYNIGVSGATESSFSLRPKYESRGLRRELLHFISSVLCVGWQQIKYYMWLIAPYRREGFLCPDYLFYL